MDKSYYRLVPYRFFLDPQADRCKLENLTEIFPEMKSLIELEFFKSSNFTQMIDRLSRIYPPSSALDIRDDTMHVFLGPYHICLGPALAATYRFKYLSTALLAASKSKERRGRRRREFVLRHFRRLVRKLIMIKSILNQLRLTSILTPYNQYALVNNGIYDLVLAGHQSDASAIFDESSFAAEIEHLRAMNHPDEKSFLLASNFIKMNTILQLLSTSHQEESNRTVPVPLTKTDPLPDESNVRGSNRLIDATPICCSQHNRHSSMVPFASKSSLVPQPVQFISRDSRSPVNSAHSSSHRASFALSRQNTATSQADSNTGEGPGHRSTSEGKDEDHLVEQISSLVSNYILSHRQPFPHVHDSKSSSEIELQSIFPSNISSTSISHLLNRVKTVVDHRVQSTLSSQARRKQFSLRTVSYQHDSSSKTTEDRLQKSQSLDVPEESNTNDLWTCL